VFVNFHVAKHVFPDIQPALCSNSYITTAALVVALMMRHQGIKLIDVKMLFTFYVLVTFKKIFPAFFKIINAT